MIGFSPRCYYCKHLHHSPGEKITCNAFPDGIPDEIFFDSAVDHINPYNGDHGIQFELNSSLPEAELSEYRELFDKQ